MAIHELDIQIRHWSGRSNTNADALLRAPLEENDCLSQKEAVGVIANIAGGEGGLAAS